MFTDSRALSHVLSKPDTYWFNKLFFPDLENTQPWPSAVITSLLIVCSAPTLSHGHGMSSSHWRFCSKSKRSAGQQKQFYSLFYHHLNNKLLDTIANLPATLTIADGCSCSHQEWPCQLPIITITSIPALSPHHQQSPYLGYPPPTWSPHLTSQNIFSVRWHN